MDLLLKAIAIFISLPCILACLKVPKGQVTFDSEGNDNPRSRYFSRVPHVPSATSGITIGRGYDLGSKSRRKTEKDMRKAGINKYLAKLLSKGAGLRGVKAKLYLQENNLLHRVITREQQCNLFLISYNEEERVAVRVVRKYTNVRWKDIPFKMQQILVDLKFRGDLLLFKNIPSQSALKKAIQEKSMSLFISVMKNRKYWRNVPLDRFRRRVIFLRKE